VQGNGIVGNKSRMSSDWPISKVKKQHLLI